MYVFYAEAFSSLVRMLKAHALYNHFFVGGGCQLKRNQKSLSLLVLDLDTRTWRIYYV